MMPSEPVANITLTNCSWWIPDDSWWFDMKSRSVSRSVSRRVFLSSFLIHSSVMTVSLSHRIHVWNICQHWGYIDGKCYHIYHTWILWVWKMGCKMAPAGDFPSEPRPAAWSKTCRWSHWTEPCRALAARSSKPFSWGCPWRTARTTALSMIDSDSMIDPSLIVMTS